MTLHATGTAGSHYRHRSISRVHGRQRNVKQTKVANKKKKEKNAPNIDVVESNKSRKWDFEPPVVFLLFALGCLESVREI